MLERRRSSQSIQSLLILLPAFLLTSFNSLSQDTAATADKEWKARLNQGISWLREQKFERAQQEFLQATRLQKNRSEGFLYLGVADLHLNQLAEAETALRRAVILNPRSA